MDIINTYLLEHCKLNMLPVFTTESFDSNVLDKSIKVSLVVRRDFVTDFISACIGTKVQLSKWHNINTDIYPLCKVSKE